MTFSKSGADEKTPAGHSHQGYCWPSLGEPCGECHRCAPSCGDEHGDGICEHSHPQLWAEGRTLVQAIHDRKAANG